MTEFFQIAVLKNPQIPTQSNYAKMKAKLLANKII